MEIFYVNLEDDEAKRIYKNLRCAFRRIINNNRVFDYNHHFNIDSVSNNHEKANEERAEANYEVYDYYFKIDGKYYALDITHVPDDLGYVNSYFQIKYGDDYDKLFYCELFSFNDYIEYAQTRNSITFIYDKDKNQVVEVLDISKYGIVLGDSRTIWDVKEENLNKVLSN